MLRATAISPTENNSPADVLNWGFFPHTRREHHYACKARRGVAKRPVRFRDRWTRQWQDQDHSKEVFRAHWNTLPRSPKLRVSEQPTRDGPGRGIGHNRAPAFDRRSWDRDRKDAGIPGSLDSLPQAGCDLDGNEESARAAVFQGLAISSIVI